ncbi:Endodeoxyribonuclease RusA [Pelotomaculum sp. FP]|uniref:RusA family crossover junction endodeoxyribonuclease n=1 Tax=Pelotomaculum sp. FP TaxID=261474 RepID=UPI0010663161|nr:RusA family crossover junction endodeoxyribonuclease [Pelotomaculum sp. FP]TEB12152.1 Endodeoxyribonuclease RusA [Pelotomaculum sp. FP]
MNEVKITIPGRPVPKGRPRIGYRGRSVILYTPPETENYEKDVARAGKEACTSPATGTVEMEIAVYFNPQAKGYTKGGRRRPGTLPDLDNCVKSIVDGLNKVAYVDERQVTRILAERKIDQVERAEVVVREELKGTSPKNVGANSFAQTP